MPDKNPQSVYTLAPLEYFDPRVFISSDKDEQKVCNFVLALALIYNDYHDLLWASGLHLENPPVAKLSGERGHYMGLHFHILRLIYANFRETMYLISGHQDVLSNSMFQRVVQSLNKEEKKYWTALVDVSLGRNTETTDFNKFLGLIRNKLTFHYSAIEPLMSGFRQYFLDDKNQKVNDAFISRGKSMSTTRFYFADAAIGGAFNCAWAGKEKEFAIHSSEYARNIRTAIYGVVTHFIQNVRRAAWQEYCGE
jgi:hypothetical protein